MAKMLFVQKMEWQQLGIMYISGSLRKEGHETDLVIGTNWNEISSAIERFKPHAVGFSIMTGAHQWAIEIGQQIKEHYPNVLTVYGGPHCTFFPAFVENEGVDIIIRGEGEEAAAMLMNRIDGGMDYLDIPNLWTVRDGKVIQNDFGKIGNIDDIPFPDRHLYDKYLDKVDMSVMNVLASRGCPFSCSFCFEETQRQLYAGKGKYVRLRTHENLLSEIKQAIGDGYEFDNIFYVDDIFGMQRSWLEGYLKVYKEQVGRPFSCLIRTEIIHADEHYATLLASAGCNSVAFGIESGNEELRNLILQKNLKNENIISVSERLHAAGIKFKTFNIFGSPGETPEQAFETVELNIRIRADYPQSNLFIPFPNTALTHYAMRKGYLRSDFSADDISLSSFIHGILESPHNLLFERLNKLFQTAVLYPSLWPLIKRISSIKFRFGPLERLLDLWFGYVYFMVYLKSSQRDPVRMFIYALKNFRETLGLNWPSVGKSGGKKLKQVESRSEQHIHVKHRIGLKSEKVESEKHSA